LISTEFAISAVLPPACSAITRTALQKQVIQSGKSKIQPATTNFRPEDFAQLVQ